MAEITLTDRERCLIQRRRDSMTLEKAAEKQGIHRNTLLNRENRGDVKVDHFEPTQTELAFISRRRLGMTQQECADLLGVSRFWFNQMELGKVPNEALLKFWEK